MDEGPRIVPSFDWCTVEGGERTERDGSGTTSRGKLNWNPTEPNVLSKEGEPSLGYDVRDGHDDYDVYEVFPPRRVLPRHRTAPARLWIAACSMREATRRGVGVASPLFNSIATYIPLITGNIPPATALDDSQRLSFSVLFCNLFVMGRLGNRKLERSVPSCSRYLPNTLGSRADVRTF